MQNLAQAFLALVKANGVAALTPFTTALLLSLGRVHRYEDKVGPRGEFTGMMVGSA